MKRPAASTVLRYLRTLAAGLGLAHWDLELSDQPPKPDSWCDIGVHREASHALVRVDPVLFREPLAVQRQVFVHELVHVYLAPLDWSIADITAHLSESARSLALATWGQRSERAADDLAKLLAPGLPLPPWKGAVRRTRVT